MKDHIEKEYEDIQNIWDKQERCAELFYFLCNAPLGAEMKRIVQYDYKHLYKQLYR